MKEYERLTERRETPLVMSQWGGTSKELKIYNRLAELEDKIENGTLMEINKPFIKKTKYGSYIICKATVIWVEDFDSKAEAEKKLKELKEMQGK